MNTIEIKEHLKTAFAKAGYNFGDYDITVSVSPRMTKSLGVCESVRVNGKLTPREIKISKKLLETSTLPVIKDVIYHEAAHALVTIETQEKHGHDEVFKAMCHRIGTKNDGTCCQEFEVEDPDKYYKYTAYCNECGRFLHGVSRTCKMVQYPHTYKCGKCGGSIFVKQNW